MKAVPARSLGRCHFLVEIEIGGGAAGDQARTTIEREILDCPLDEHEHPALELNEVHQVNQCPDKPRWESGKVQAENVGHGRRSADHRQTAFVQILEWRQRFLASYSVRDCPPCVSS